MQRLAVMKQKSESQRIQLSSILAKKYFWTLFHQSQSGFDLLFSIPIRTAPSPKYTDTGRKVPTYTLVQFLADYTVTLIITGNHHQQPLTTTLASDYDLILFVARMA